MKAEDYRSINVNQMHREGVLIFGRMGRWGWWRDGERVAWINYRMEERGLRLLYNFRQNGGDWEDIDYVVPVVFKPCHFGGQRPYFLCPGVVNGQSCNQRVVKLYSRSRYFLCRHCYRLSYRSQSESQLDRLMRKANKKRTQMGGDPGMCSPIPRRPKGMWHRTYERKIDEIFDAEELLDAKLASWMLTRFGDRGF